MSPSPVLRRAALAPLLAPVVGLLLLAPGVPVRAAGAVVSVQDFSFTPATVTVGLGQTVTWQFHAMHTTTSNQRFWDSGMRTSGDFSVSFPDAGSFRYHCSMHPSMTGVVRVPVTATGSAADGWRVRWSVRSATPSDRRFDVQYKRAGAHGWIAFRTDTAKRAGRFHPAGSGRYLIRARTHNGSAGASSWSPRRAVRIG